MSARPRAVQHGIHGFRVRELRWGGGGDGEGCVLWLAEQKIRHVNSSNSARTHTCQHVQADVHVSTCARIVSCRTWLTGSLVLVLQMNVLLRNYGKQGHEDRARVVVTYIKVFAGHKRQTASQRIRFLGSKKSGTRRRSIGGLLKKWDKRWFVISTNEDDTYSVRYYKTDTAGTRRLCRLCRLYF